MEAADYDSAETYIRNLHQAVEKHRAVHDEIPAVEVDRSASYDHIPNKYSFQESLR